MAWWTRTFFVSSTRRHTRSKRDWSFRRVLFRSLLYLKPALKGDGPEDLLGYCRINQSFPHDSTADQWFAEERFENYRNLGYVSALAAEKELRDKIADVPA